MATIIDKGSFANAAPSKFGGDVVTQSLTVEGPAKTQTLSFESYEAKPCAVYQGKEHKRPPCQVQLAAADDGSTMAVRLCDEGKGTVVPVANIDEAQAVIDRYCKCARSKPATVRKKCGKKVAQSGVLGNVSMSTNEVFTPEQAAQGMLKRYFTPKVAAEMAHLHAMDYREGDPRREYWETVSRLIRSGGTTPTIGALFGLGSLGSTERLPVASLPEKVREAIRRTAPNIKTVVLRELDVPITRLMPVPPKWEPLKHSDHRDAISAGAGGRIEANYSKLVGQWPQYQVQEDFPIDLGPTLGPWFIVHYFVRDYGPAAVSHVEVTAQKGTVNKALFPGHSEATQVQLNKLEASYLFLHHHYNSRGRREAITRVQERFGVDTSWVKIAMDGLLEKGLAKYTANKSILLTPQGTAVASRLPRVFDPIYGPNSAEGIPNSYLAGT